MSDNTIQWVDYRIFVEMFGYSHSYAENFRSKCASELKAEKKLIPKGKLSTMYIAEKWGMPIEDVNEYWKKAKKIPKVRRKKKEPAATDSPKV